MIWVDEIGCMLLPLNLVNVCLFEKRRRVSESRTFVPNWKSIFGNAVKIVRVVALDRPEMGLSLGQNKVDILA